MPKGVKQQKKNYSMDFEELGDGKLIPEKYIDIMLVTAINAIPRALESDTRDIEASLNAGMSTYCVVVDMLQRFSEARELLEEDSFKEALEKEMEKNKEQLDKSKDEQVKACLIANLKLKEISKKIFPSAPKTGDCIM